jgi:very-short-patch-repair endonuclease
VTATSRIIHLPENEVSRLKRKAWEASFRRPEKEARIGQHKDKMSAKKLIKAGSMRQNPTRAEARLYRLLEQHINEVVRKQYPLFGYIADFYIPRLKLVIEADGDSHIPETDRIRDGHLAVKGIATLRIQNQTILCHPAKTLSLIRSSLSSRRNYIPKRRSGF